MPISLCERLSFDKLFRISDPKRVYRSFTVRGPPLEIDSYQDTVYYIFNFKANPSTTGLRHRGYIKFFKPKHKSAKDVPLQHLECLVDCACPDFRFKYSWAVKQRGSSVVGPNSLNQAHNRAPKITNPTGRPGLCVAAGELISTKRGFIPIEEVKVGDFAWTLSGWQRVTAAAQTGHKQVVAVKLKSGRALRVTPEHEVYAFLDGEGFSWVPAKDLTPKHVLCITASPASGEPVLSYDVTASKANGNQNTKVYETRKVVLDATLAELMGYMVAEGSSGRFSNYNEKLKEDFYAKWRATFGAEAVTLDGAGCCIGLHGSRILKDLGFVDGSYGKVVPDWVMRGNLDIIAGFLRGCYAGDGNFRNRGSTYATVSKKLAQQIQLLLASIGVSATLEQSISGVNKSIVWLLRTSSRDVTDKLYALLKPLRGYSHFLDGGGCAYHNYFISNSTRLLKTVVAKSLSMSQDDSIVLLKEMGARIPDIARVSIDAVARELTASGLIIKQRLRKGGKAHNAAKVSDIYKTNAAINHRVNGVIRQLSLPSRSEWRVHRMKLLPAISQLKSLLPDAWSCLKDLVRTDVFFDVVESVTPADTTDVYDLTVENTSHFTVNGVVVHNCKHILAARQYIYGLLSSFPGDEPDTAEKLNKLTKISRKRWSDYGAAMQAAKDREKIILQRRAQRNTGELKPEPVAPILPEPLTPDAKADKKTPAAKTKLPTKPTGKPAANIKPVPLPPQEPASASKKAGDETDSLFTKQKNKPRRVIGNRIVKGMIPGQTPGTWESLQTSVWESVVNATGEQNMSTLRNALKLVQEMEADELALQQPEPNGDEFGQSAGGIDGADIMGDPMEPPVSDSAIGADTEGETALGLLRQMKDLLTQIVTAVAPEQGGADAGIDPDAELSGDAMPEEPPAAMPDEFGADDKGGESGESDEDESGEKEEDGQKRPAPKKKAEDEED